MEKEDDVLLLSSWHTRDWNRKYKFYTCRCKNSCLTAPMEVGVGRIGEYKDAAGLSWEYGVQHFSHATTSVNMSELTNDRRVPHCEYHIERHHSCTKIVSETDMCKLVFTSLPSVVQFSSWPGAAHRSYWAHTLTQAPNQLYKKILQTTLLGKHVPKVASQ